jgi:hypothetical protein
MKLTTKQRRTALLLKVLNRLERREYRRWVAQDETEGTGQFYWKFPEDEHIDDDEFKELLALAIGFQKSKKLHASLSAKRY